MVEESALPFPYYLEEDQIVDEIVKFATSHHNPSKWHGQCFYFFKSNNAHPNQDLREGSARISRLKRELERNLARQEQSQSPLLEPGPDEQLTACLLYTSPSPRDKRQSRMPSSA